MPGYRYQGLITKKLLFGEEKAKRCHAAGLTWTQYMVRSSQKLSKLPLDIEVVWDGLVSVHILTPPGISTCGLCGNNDMDPNNDPSGR